MRESNNNDKHMIIPVTFWRNAMVSSLLNLIFKNEIINSIKWITYLAKSLVPWLYAMMCGGLLLSWCVEKVVWYSWGGEYSVMGGCSLKDWPSGGLCKVSKGLCRIWGRFWFGASKWACFHKGKYFSEIIYTIFLDNGFF